MDKLPTRSLAAFPKSEGSGSSRRGNWCDWQKARSFSGADWYGYVLIALDVMVVESEWYDRISARRSYAILPTPRQTDFIRHYLMQ